MPQSRQRKSTNKTKQKKFLNCGWGAGNSVSTMPQKYNHHDFRMEQVDRRPGTRPYLEADKSLSFDTQHARALQLSSRLFLANGFTASGRVNKQSAIRTEATVSLWTRGLWWNRNAKPLKEIRLEVIEKHSGVICQEEWGLDWCLICISFSRDSLLDVFALIN